MKVPNTGTASRVTDSVERAMGFLRKREQPEPKKPSRSSRKLDKKPEPKQPAAQALAGSDPIV